MTFDKNTAEDSQIKEEDARDILERLRLEIIDELQILYLKRQSESSRALILEARLYALDFFVH